MDRQANDLLTLKVIAETLNRSNDMRKMLQLVLEKLLEVTGLKVGWIFLLFINRVNNFFHGFIFHQ